MSVSREDLSLKMWQLQEAVQRLRVNVRTVHDTKCALFSAAWRKVSAPIACRSRVRCMVAGRESHCNTRTGTLGEEMCGRVFKQSVSGRALHFC